MPDTAFYITLLPSGRRIAARRGERLLSVLMNNGLFLRSDCGGKGTCGKCAVFLVHDDGSGEMVKACCFEVVSDIRIEIPESSLGVSHILDKAPVVFPPGFEQRFKHSSGPDRYGMAVDLGTTTIAIYLCNTARGRVMSSAALKNPQAIHGDDVMARILAAGQSEEKRGILQRLVVRAINRGMADLLSRLEVEKKNIRQMTVVGNPAMIHLFAGIDPCGIGVAPYKPAFFEARSFSGKDLGFEKMDFSIQTLPQVSGFIGGDILAAALACDFENQPEGTLLMDLGTNGELMLKAKDRIFATSCATGPAFEGSSLSFGMHAVPGAVNRVIIEDPGAFCKYTVIQPPEGSGKASPAGLCGTGVISAAARLLENDIIRPDGAFVKNPAVIPLTRTRENKAAYTLVPGHETENGRGILVTQKDIRSIQLGKSALITGIKLLQKEAGIESLEAILIAGAFGSHADTSDMMTLGMIPPMDPDRVRVVGNAAGAGAVMVLCDPQYLESVKRMADSVSNIDLASSVSFQDVFVRQLSFL